MLSISLVDHRTLLIEGRLGKEYELLFSLDGKPTAFRIKITLAHLEYQYLVHKLAGARIPKTWRENSKLEEHSEQEWPQKLQAFIHIAGDS